MLAISFLYTFTNTWQCSLEADEAEKAIAGWSDWLDGSFLKDAGPTLKKRPAGMLAIKDDKEGKHVAKIAKKPSAKDLTFEEDMSEDEKSEDNSAAQVLKKPCGEYIFVLMKQ